MPIISIVVPCYNEEEALPLFYQEATRVAGEMSGIDFEFVSSTTVRAIIPCPCCAALPRRTDACGSYRFHAISVRRPACSPVLEAATGDYVALMDADLQDPPALLPELYRAGHRGGLRLRRHPAHHPRGRAAHPLVFCAHVLQDH